jgi:hypothetical protein
MLIYELQASLHQDSLVYLQVAFRLFKKIQNFFCDIALIPTFPSSIAFPLHFMGRGPRALKAAFLRANKPT